MRPPSAILRGATERVAAEIVSYPERAEAVALAVELAEVVAVGIPRLPVTAVGVHRPVAIRPNLDRARLPRLSQVTRLWVDGYDFPQGAVALLTRCGRHVRECL